MVKRPTAEIEADLRKLVEWFHYESPKAANQIEEAAARLVELDAEVQRVRHALSATTVAEMVARLTKAADFFDPADDYLLVAARTLNESDQAT